MFNLNSLIEINNDVRFGKPIIKGTRISVGDILTMLANGLSTQEIIDDFPQINLEQIRACLEFAANRERILAVAV
jgi:uncharacterized protein (DUF433 family)